MKHRLRAIIALSASSALLLVLGAYAWLFWSPYDTLLRGDGYEGLVSSASRLHPRYGAWDPTQEVIDDMEHALASYVEERLPMFGTGVLARLPTYRRNYWCITENGRRLIVVDFYAPQIVSRRQWLNGMIINGGRQEDNWSISYDPDTRQFTNAYPFTAARSDEICQPVGPANGSQPIRSDTNSTSAAAGSRR